ncbi:hypothetical protein D3C76_1296710 [compost metagenome]
MTKPIPFQPASEGSKHRRSSRSSDSSRRSASSASMFRPMSYCLASRVSDSRRGYSSSITRSYWARL